MENKLYFLNSPAVFNILEDLRRGITTSDATQDKLAELFPSPSHLAAEMLPSDEEIDEMFPLDGVGLGNIPEKCQRDGAKKIRDLIIKRLYDEK